MEVNQKRAFLDTNIVVRYFTGAPPEQAAQAARIINEVGNLCLTDVVLTETAYILRDQYRISREDIVDLLMRLVQADNISVYALDKKFVLEGLLMCRPSGRVSISDAMIWAAARTAGASAIYTLDQRFPSDNIELRS